MGTQFLLPLLEYFFKIITSSKKDVFQHKKHLCLIRFLHDASRFTVKIKGIIPDPSHRFKICPILFLQPHMGSAITSFPIMIGKLWSIRNQRRPSECLPHQPGIFTKFQILIQIQAV